MKKIFNNQNTKIIFLSIILILLLGLLYLCKINNSENFQNIRSIVRNSEFTNLSNNIKKELVNRYKVKDFKIKTIDENSVEYEFYEPDKIYKQGNQLFFDADLSDKTLNIVNSYFELHEYLLVIGIYKFKNDNYILKNYKIVNINPSQLNQVDDSSNVIKYYNTTTNISSKDKPLKIFRNKIKLDKFDENNKLNYYKFGIITVLKYEGETSNTLSMTQTEIKNVENIYIAQKDYKFPLKSMNVETVDKDWEDYSNMKKEEREGKVVDESTGEVISTANGEYEMIKKNLGGYPDNLLLQLNTNYKTLNELIKGQLSQGILDINVHTEEL